MFTSFAQQNIQRPSCFADVCDSPYYLVSGLQPVANNQMTASSEHLPGDGGNYGPSQARLNNTLVDFANNTYNAGAWAVQKPPNTNQFIQVCLNFTETAALFCYLSFQDAAFAYLYIGYI